jgi:CheY-like chemotaxis protein
MGSLLRSHPALAGRKTRGLPGLAGLRALVVEDEFLIATEIEQILVGCGCIILGPEATLDGAFAQVAKQPPDVVILDLNLRWHSVEPLVRPLVADRIPFVGITGHPELPKGIFSGAPIVEKPFGAAELARAVAEAVGRT